MPAQQPQDKPSALQGMVEKVAGKDESRSSFPVALIISLVAIAGFAFMGWMLMRAKRKAALLASKIRKMEEAKKQEAENAALKDSDEAKKKAAEKIEQLDKDIAVLRGQLKDASADNEKRRAELMKASDWSELGL